MYKIFDHHLLMNKVLPEFLCGLQVHAVIGGDTDRYYLPGVVTNENTTYFTAPHPLETQNIAHPSSARHNAEYYKFQRGGHGLFHRADPVYLQVPNSSALVFAGRCLYNKASSHNPFAVW